MDIATEFKSNNGSTLRDALEGLARDANTLSEYAHGFRHEFINKFAVLEGTQMLMSERMEAFGEQLGEVKSQVNNVAGEVTEVKSDVAELKSMVDRRAEPRKDTP